MKMATFMAGLRGVPDKYVELSEDLALDYFNVIKIELFETLRRLFRGHRGDLIAGLCNLFFIEFEQEGVLVTVAHTLLLVLKTDEIAQTGVREKSVAAMSGPFIRGYGKL
ncbi:hypothetical protein [Azotobacter armeniacus]